jgi:hypothetical protein
VIRGKRNLIGKRFGRLVVESQVIRTRPDGKDDILWRCVCDCGAVKEVYTNPLVREKQPTVSCGCFHVDNKTTHGHSRTKEYKAYNSMLNRCYNEDREDFQNYGGRGIEVCEEWRRDYLNFIEAMGICPEGFSLERVDVDGDYCPENCKWADPLTQAANKRISNKNKSGRSGVYKKGSKWEAVITRDRVVYDLGVFSDFGDACKAREEAEIALFGFIKR